MGEDSAIEIWPLGDTDFGAGIVAGQKIVMIQLRDQVTGRIVRLGFNEGPFVSLADHMRMIADHIADGTFFTGFPPTER